LPSTAALCVCQKQYIEQLDLERFGGVNCVSASGEIKRLNRITQRCANDLIRANRCRYATLAVRPSARHILTICAARVLKIKNVAN
jgi:hypothetical protein